jgi:pimeloyl-ACP methyl ester carboxylesterase
MGTVTSKDGTTIAFDRSGQGPAVILVDGALCYRGFGPMPGLAALLAPHFTVFTYDRRGRGESGDTQPFAVEREVEDIDALIAEAGGSAFVHGTSSGAALALEAARQLPVRIIKLSLYEPPYFTAEDNAQRPPKDYQQQLTKLVEAGRRGDAVALFMQVVGQPPEAIAGMRQAPMWPMFEAVAPTLVYDAAAMADFSVPTARAASVSVPALVIYGGASPASMQDGVQALADAIPGAQRRVLEGQTHEVAADAIASVLEQFFTA